MGAFGTYNTPPIGVNAVPFVATVNIDAGKAVSVDGNGQLVLSSNLSSTPLPCIGVSLNPALAGQVCFVQVEDSLVCVNRSGAPIPAGHFLGDIDGTGNLADMTVSGGISIAGICLASDANTIKIFVFPMNVGNSTAAAAFKEVTGTLTAAQINALNTTPITLIPAPGAGKLIIIDKSDWNLVLSGAFFTGASSVSVVYGASGQIMVGVGNASFMSQGSSAEFTTAQASSTTGFPTSTTINQPANITASAAIGGGAGSVLTYRIRYRVVTAA